MADENKLQEMIRTSLESIRAMVDANTVVGNPIETPSGTTVIPISKVSVGYASGGLDSKKIEEKKMFAGGGGTGLTVSPVGFLIVDANGDVEFLNVGQKGKPDPVDQIADFVERTPDIIEKIKNIFSKEPKETL